MAFQPAFKGSASLLYRLVLTLFLSTVISDSIAQSRPPNFIVILADDLGFGDLGCYGHPTILTPHLDRMASEGMKFTQFYAGAAVCTPSRAALLTGRLGVRTGVYGKKAVFRTNSAGGLPLKEITIAEVLKDRGYATGIIGKWHLGHLPQFLPLSQGFDYWFGTPYSNDMGKVLSTRRDPNNPEVPVMNPKAPPLPLYRNNEIIEEEPDQRFLTTRYTEEALQFISKNRSRPFFLYYASNFPHVPLYASPQYEGNSKRGLYGDVVRELDGSVGRLLKALKELDLDSNTLVLFTSDNGPWLTQFDHGGSAGILYEGKNSTYEGGMRVPALAWWPGTIKAGGVSTALVSALDLLPTFTELAGGTAPAGKIQDGYDLSGLFTGKDHPQRELLYYYIEGELYAVRKGKWKAHFITHASYSREQPEVHLTPLLYNIEEDPSEKYDLAAHHPGVVDELKKEYERQRSIRPVSSEIDKLLE